MCRPCSIFLPFAVALLLAAPTLAGEPAKQREPWDQAKLTQLSGELAESVSGLRASARRNPPPNVASGQSRSWYRVLDLLRVIEQETGALQKALEAGEGHDETLPIFERIEELRVRAAQEGRRLFLPEGTMTKIRNARGVLEKIRPYYDAKPPTDPGIPGSTG
jgi:hypothetical protein